MKSFGFEVVEDTPKQEFGFEVVDDAPATEFGFEVVETAPEPVAVAPGLADRAAAVDKDLGMGVPFSTQPVADAAVPVPAAPVGTQLSPEEETQFAVWKQKNAPNDSGFDYDLRGRFKSLKGGDQPAGHGPDTFKLPNHPTFSIDSQFSTPETPGGVWGRDAQGRDTYQPSAWMAQDPQRMTDLEAYFKEVEPNGVLLPPQEETQSPTQDLVGPDPSPVEVIPDLSIPPSVDVPDAGTGLADAERGLQASLEAEKERTIAGAVGEQLDFQRSEIFRNKLRAGNVTGSVADHLLKGGWDTSIATRSSVASMKSDREALRAIQKEDADTLAALGNTMDLSESSLGGKIVKGAAGSLEPMLESMIVGGAAGSIPVVGGVTGKLATGAYWQQQGAGSFVRAFLRDRDIDSLSDEQLKQMNLVAQGMGVPYGAVELIVASIPGMKALGSGVDHQIANAIFRKVLANPTLIQKIAKGGTAFGIRVAIESLFEEGAQGGIEEGASQMLDKVESGNMKALFDYDWSKVVDQFKKQGFESVPAVLGITALGGAAAGVANRISQTPAQTDQAAAPPAAATEQVVQPGVTTPEGLPVTLEQEVRLDDQGQPIQTDQPAPQTQETVVPPPADADAQGAAAQPISPPEQPAAKPQEATAVESADIVTTTPETVRGVSASDEKRVFTRDDGKDTVEGELVEEDDNFVTIRTSATETRKLNKKFWNEEKQEADSRTDDQKVADATAGAGRIVAPIEIEDKALSAEADSLGLVPEAFTDFGAEAKKNDIDIGESKQYTFSTPDGIITFNLEQGESLTEKYNDALARNPSYKPVVAQKPASSTPPAPTETDQQLEEAAPAQGGEPRTYRTIAEARKATGATRNRIEGEPGKYTVRDGESKAVVKKPDTPIEAVEEVKEDVAEPVPVEEEPTEQKTAPQSIEDQAKDKQQAGFVSTPQRAGLDRVLRQTGRLIRRKFTGAKGLDASTRAATLQRKQSHSAAIIQGQASRTEFKQARTSLIRKHGKAKVATWLQDVAYGEKTVEEFGKEFGLERGHVALRVLEKFNSERVSNSKEVARLLEEQGAPAELVDKVRDDEFYMSRFYMKHLMGDEFVPRTEDFEAAALEIKSGIEESIERLEESATKVRGKQKRTDIDIVEYLKTRDVTALDGLSKSRRDRVQSIALKYDKLNQVIDAVIYDEEGNVKVNVNTEALLDASRSTVDFFLNRKQSGPGAVDTSNLKKRFLEGAFRTLYQEVTDPVFSAGKTIEAQEQLIANMTMFNTLANQSEGKSWTEFPSTKAGTSEKLGSEQNVADRMRYGKLAGKHVTKELHDAITGGKQSSRFLKWAWFKPMGIMRGMKLLGPKTIVRNYAEAYLGFGLRSGDALRKGYGRNYNRATKLANDFILPAAAEKRLGKKSAAQREVAELIKDGVFSLRGNTQAEEVTNLLTQDPRNWTGKHFRKAMELYSMIDFPTKVASFWTMQEHFEKQGSSKEEAKKKAIKHVQDMYQNPEALPEIMQGISKSGVTDFAGYFIDSIRIAKNEIQFAIDSAKKGDLIPATGFTLGAAIDASRRTAKIAGLSAGLHLAFATIQQKIRGDDDEIEEVEEIEGGTRQAAIREFMPEWYTDAPLLTWEETRKDGSKTVHYAALGGNSAFPMEDLVYGAFQSEVDNKRVPASVAKRLFDDKLNPMQPGMYPSALWKLLSGDVLGGGFQSQGFIEAYSGNDPDRNRILMESVLGFSSDIFLGQFGTKVQQTVAIKRKQAGDTEPKAGTFTPQRSIREVWTSLINPTRTYTIDNNEAQILVRRDAISLRHNLMKSKGKVSARFDAMEKWHGATTEFQDSEAERGERLRISYLKDATAIASNARIAFKGVLTDQQISDALKKGLGASKEEMTAVMADKVESIPAYVPQRFKPKKSSNRRPSRPRPPRR